MSERTMGASSVDMLACEDTGAHVGQGTVVVLLHAFPLSSAMWRGQIEALQNEHRVVAPDLRGFGQSPGWDDETPAIAFMADDVAALLDELGITEPITLCGLSMGGYVALAFAQKYPQRLRALVLADTQAAADDEAGRVQRDANIAFTREHTPLQVIERVLPRMVSETTKQQRPDALENVANIASAQTTQGIITGLQALRDRPDRSIELPGIAAPTLIIVGRDDGITPPDAARKMADAIPNAQLQIIEGAGHLSNLEMPEEFNEVLLKFLRSLH